MSDRNGAPIAQPENLTQLTDLERLARAVSNTQEAQVFNMPEAAFLLHSKNMTVTDLESLAEKHLAAPVRRHGNVAISRLPSLIEYAKRYKGDASLVLASAEISGNDFDAAAKVIFNPAPGGPELDKTGHGDFTATYAFPVSKELKTWLEQNDENMSQPEFALFMENNNIHLAEPSSVLGRAPDANGEGGMDGWDAVAHLEKRLAGKSADPIDMIELSRGLEVKVKETVKNTFRLPSGEMALQYTVEHEDSDGQPLKVPSWFVVNVPIFEGGARHAFVARLRHRVKEGRVTFAYSLYQLEQTLDQAFTMSLELIHQETGLPIFQVESSETSVA